jgi:hypothetical protein
MLFYSKPVLDVAGFKYRSMQEYVVLEAQANIPGN